VNLYGMCQNDAIRKWDRLGLKFDFDDDHFKNLIECWKQNLPRGSELRRLIKALEDSDREYEFNKIGNDKWPQTEEKLTKGANINMPLVAEFKYVDRTWAFPEAVAHEIKHAYDSEKGDPNKGHDHSEDWMDGEELITAEAKECSCQFGDLKGKITKDRITGKISYENYPN
jgi:hypothetical protein